MKLVNGLMVNGLMVNGMVNGGWLMVDGDGFLVDLWWACGELHGE